MSEKVYGTCSAPKRTKKFFAPKISLYRGVPHQEKKNPDPPVLGPHHNNRIFIFPVLYLRGHKTSPVWVPIEIPIETTLGDRNGIPSTTIGFLFLPYCI